jgi:hypothetical protein
MAPELLPLRLDSPDIARLSIEEWIEKYIQA